jgi:hypothetical protein
LPKGVSVEVEALVEVEDPIPGFFKRVMQWVLFLDNTC